MNIGKVQKYFQTLFCNVSLKGWKKVCFMYRDVQNFYEAHFKSSLEHPNDVTHVRTTTIVCDSSDGNGQWYSDLETAEFWVTVLTSDSVSSQNSEVIPVCYCK